MGLRLGRLRMCLFVVGIFWTVSQSAAAEAPYVIVLGIAQDGGVPQAGSKDLAAWRDKTLKRHVVCLAIVNPADSARWLIECTPDFGEQLHMLDTVAPVAARPGISGVFLTHAHIGHYTGLIHLGHEAMGARAVPVFAMPRMREFLESNGPWSQLARYGNMELRPLRDNRRVSLGPQLSVIPILVPHRQEFSEVVAYRIDGPNRSVLFVPDIDSWTDWDQQGTRVEEVIGDVDVAYVDGTFFADGEIPGRDMSTFPHPFIVHSMERFASLPRTERGKVRFIHLNHTNPALIPGSKARVMIERNGYRMAEELERVDL